MGWSTWVPVTIEFNRETYDNISKVEEDIKESERLIRLYEDRLLVLASMHPEDLKSTDIEDNPIPLTDSIRDEVYSAIKDLKEELIIKHELELLKANFELRKGDFVKNPKFDENFKKWMEDNCYNKEEE